jgi:hypothetical protein
VKESIRIHWLRTEELKRTEDLKSIPPQDLIALWEFTEEHVEKLNGLDNPSVEKHSERRRGAMVIIKSLQALPTAISAVLKEAVTSRQNSGPRGDQGNMLHVALVGINNPMSSLQDRFDALDFFPFYFYFSFICFRFGCITCVFYLCTYMFEV